MSFNSTSKKRLKQSFQWFGNHEIKCWNIWIYFGKHTDRCTHVKNTIYNYKQNVECLPLKRNFNWCMDWKWRVRNRFTNRESINFSKRRFDFGCKIIQQIGMKPMLCHACGFEVWGLLDLWNKSSKTVYKKWCKATSISRFRDRVATEFCFKKLMLLSWVKEI